MWRGSALAASLVAWGCSTEAPSETGSPAEKLSYTCELGTIDGAGFTPVNERGTLELMMGFQGFVLVSLAVRTDAPPDDSSLATYGITIDGTDPVGGQQPEVRFADGGSGAVSDEVLAFFTGNYVSYYAGRSAHAALRVESETALCIAEADAVLVDDDPCIHTGGEPDCPDTGT
jgi:hypothetical protein